MKNQNRSRALEVKSADICGEFLSVSSCVITVILVTLYITEINLSLSLICIRVRRLSGDPLECVVQMWRLPSLGQQRLGLICLVALDRLAIETAK